MNNSPIYADPKSSPMSHEELTHRLQHQAQAYAPRPPAGALDRAMQAIAQLDSPAPAPDLPGYAATLRLILTRLLPAGAAIAAAVLLALYFFRTPPALAPSPSNDQIAHNQKRAIPRSRPSLDAPSSPTPNSLAQRFVDDPLEGEVRVLLAGLYNTSDTVTNILPNPAKRN